MDRGYLKTMAKNQIRGNIGILFAITLIIELISFAAIFVLGWVGPLGSAVNSFITPAFSLSMAIIYLNLAKGVKPRIEDAFSGFNDFWSAFKIYFFIGLFTLLWGLLFIIPGIIKMYSYSMAPYILAENKQMPALEAIRRSKEMMNGHKMDLFELLLSFIGWDLLGVVTFGIAYIWITPYQNATMVNFYNTIKPCEMFDEPEKFNNPEIEI
ncbi:MAG: DUF975 family protein [Clostridia bacterium]|nr:DUF975 family protein [Clostridia bacterium]